LYSKLVRQKSQELFNSPDFFIIIYQRPNLILTENLTLFNNFSNIILGIGK